MLNFNCCKLSIILLYAIQFVCVIVGEDSVESSLSTAGSDKSRDTRDSHTPNRLAQIFPKNDFAKSSGSAENGRSAFSQLDDQESQSSEADIRSQSESSQLLACCEMVNERVEEEWSDVGGGLHCDGLAKKPNAKQSSRWVGQQIARGRTPLLIQFYYECIAKRKDYTACCKRAGVQKKCLRICNAASPPSFEQLVQMPKVCQKKVPMSLSLNCLMSGNGRFGTRDILGSTVGVVYSIGHAITTALNPFNWFKG